MAILKKYYFWLICFPQISQQIILHMIIPFSPQTQITQVAKKTRHVLIIQWVWKEIFAANTSENPTSRKFLILTFQGKTKKQGKTKLRRGAVKIARKECGGAWLGPGWGSECSARRVSVCVCVSDGRRVSACLHLLSSRYNRTHRPVTFTGRR